MSNEKQTNEPIKNFKIGVIEAKKFEIPEIKDGVYSAVLKDIELKVNIPDGKGGNFDMLQWNFIVGKEAKEISGKSSTIISPLSKSYQWIKALTGNELEAGKDFNPESVKDTECQVVIKHQKKTRTFNNEQQVMNMPYVHDVLPK